MCYHPDHHHIPHHRHPYHHHHITTIIITPHQIVSHLSLLSPPQHPYPSEDQKKQLAQDTGLTILQVNNCVQLYFKACVCLPICLFPPLDAGSRSRRGLSFFYNILVFTSCFTGIERAEPHPASGSASPRVPRRSGGQRGTRRTPHRAGPRRGRPGSPRRTQEREKSRVEDLRPDEELNPGEVFGVGHFQQRALEADKQKLLGDNVVRGAVCFCYYVGIVGLLVPVAARRASPPSSLPSLISPCPSYRLSGRNILGRSCLQRAEAPGSPLMVTQQIRTNCY
ncbi:putative homeobox protein Meis3-like 1 [Portunus trituberculatus]|uniref:Putative homeobox protein Meis3-like 1 n=1 Tax=Portunus trituberculatus TaxID=210409 RepID=A0A5B7HPC9_PORTR|nr:putative homeobox protein Meis3-like 1 [Portunus trituberculatus]